jgi:uncharacterized protein YyaL (SSP411 family)
VKHWWIVLALALPASVANAASSSLPALAPDELALYERLCFQVEDSYDSVRSGFVDKRNVPNESATTLAFLLGSRKGGANWGSRALSTVNVMLTLEDTLRGGFYASMEKNDLGNSELNRPTGVNAHRLEALVRAWAVTGETRYWVPAARLIEFAERNVVDGRGGFVPDPVGDMQLIPQVNGLAIHAWLMWWTAARDARYRAFAHKSLDRMWEVCWLDSVGFVRHDEFGEPLEWPTLIDQAEMGRALLLSAHLTNRQQDMVRARSVAELMLSQFEDPKKGGFAGKVSSKKGVLSRGAGRESAENARACLFLCEMAHVTGDPRYLNAARRSWASFEKTLRKPRPEAADWALAMDAAMGPDLPTPPPEPTRSDDPRKPPTERRRTKSPAAKMGASGTP